MAGRFKCYEGETARMEGRPAPEGAGDDGITGRTAAEARNRGFTAQSPSGIRRPITEWIVPDGRGTPGWSPMGPAMPGGVSDPHEAQDGAGELGRGPTAAPWNRTAPSGPAAAATVETIAAADDKIRRAETPGGVVKRAVAIDEFSLGRTSVVRSGGEVGSSPFDRFAGYEAGATLKGVPRDVKYCAEIGDDGCALHLRGAKMAALARFTTW